MPQANLGLWDAIPLGLAGRWQGVGRRAKVEAQGGAAGDDGVPGEFVSKLSSRAPLGMRVNLRAFPL